MKILLVNDDGFDSILLKELEKALLSYGEVFVFAPDSEQSAKSASLTAFKGLYVNKVDSHHYRVVGTPVDCTEVGLSFIKGIDLVVSGVNNGWNLATDVMYSGTCGAAFAALLAGKKAIAISKEKLDNSKIIPLTKMTLDYIFLNNLLSTSYFLNVNFPDELTNGFKITKIKKNIKMKYQVVIAEDNYYKIANIRKYSFGNLDYDSDATYNGYISITPLGQTIFDNKNYRNVIKKISTK